MTLDESMRPDLGTIIDNTRSRGLVTGGPGRHRGPPMQKAGFPASPAWLAELRWLSCRHLARHGPFPRLEDTRLARISKYQLDTGACSSRSGKEGWLRLGDSCPRMSSSGQEVLCCPSDKVSSPHHATNKRAQAFATCVVDSFGSSGLNHHAHRALYPEAREKPLASAGTVAIQHSVY